MFVRTFKKDFIWTGSYRFDNNGILQSPQGYFNRFYDGVNMEGELQ